MMLKKLFSNYVAEALGLKILLNKKTAAFRCGGDT